jgi:hypothetical protein
LTIAISSSSQVGLPKSEYDNEENTPADDSNNGSSIAGGDGRNDNNCAANNEYSSNFVVQISPSDPLSILNDRITEITGITPTVAAHDLESNRFAATTTNNNAGGGGSTSTTLSGEAGLALLAALLGMNNNNTNNNINISGPGNSTSNMGIVRGTRMTTSAITPPSARA